MRRPTSPMRSGIIWEPLRREHLFRMPGSHQKRQATGPVSVPPHQVECIIEPFVYEYTSDRGGSVSAEHGLGQMKNQYMRCARTPQNQLNISIEPFHACVGKCSANAIAAACLARNAAAPRWTACTRGLYVVCVSWDAACLMHTAAWPGATL